MFFKRWELPAKRTTLFHTHHVTNATIALRERSEMREAAKLLAKRRAEMFAMRGVQRAVTQSMIRAFKRDDAPFAGRQHCRLQRGFHRFKTRIAENGLARQTRAGLGLWILDLGPLFKSDAAQFTRQSRLERVRMHIAHRMKQLRHLLLAGMDHARIRMTGRRDAERSGEVEILFSFRVPNMNTTSTLPNDGPRTVGFHERDVARLVGAKQRQCLFRLGMNRGGAEARRFHC